jgi:hypothetical protein
VKRDMADLRRLLGNNSNMAHVVTYTRTTQRLRWVTEQRAHTETGHQALTTTTQTTLLAYGFGARGGTRRDVGDRQGMEREAASRDAEGNTVEGRGAPQQA